MRAQRQLDHLVRIRYLFLSSPGRNHLLWLLCRRLYLCGLDGLLTDILWVILEELLLLLENRLLICQIDAGIHHILFHFGPV